MVPTCCTGISAIHLFSIGDTPVQPVGTNMIILTLQASSSPCTIIKLILHAYLFTLQSSRRMSASPKTEIHFELAKCCSEVDITMIDRIQSLLSPQPLAQTASSSHYLYSTSNTLTQVGVQIQVVFSFQPRGGKSPGDYCLDFFSSSLSCSQVPATHMKIGHLRVPNLQMSCSGLT